MFRTLKYGVIAVAEFLGIVAWFQRRSEAKRNEQLGAAKEKLASAKNVQKRVKTAKRAVRRSTTDPEFRRRVRRKYTKPE